MKLAVTFEIPLMADQIDGEGLLTDRAFSQVSAVCDRVQQQLVKVVTGTETAPCAGYAYEIIEDQDGLLMPA